MRKLVQHPLFIPISLLAVSLVCYGLLIVQPGFFGDDLSILWLYKRSGLSGLSAFFESKQPLTALLLLPFLKIIGEHTWIYQLLAVLLRWLGAWTFWTLIKEIWPKNGGKAVVAALIFLAFPGFKQIPVAISILPHLLTLCITLVSFLLLYRGIITPQFRGIKLGTAWLASIALYISPYFIGLELLRPWLIWVGWKRAIRSGEPNPGKITNTDLVRKTLLTWLPYAVSLGVCFLISGLNGLVAPENNKLSPAFIEFFKTILRDLLEVLLLIWRQIFRIPENSSQIFSYLLIVVFVGGLVFIVLRGFEKNEFTSEKNGPDDGKSWQKEFLMVGLAAALAGGLPIWLGQEKVGLNYPDSVVTLAFLPGAALLITGLINLLLLPQFQTGLAALLISLSAGMHIQNSTDFTGEWKQVERIVQQLHSRMPAVKVGTILVSEQLPLNYFSEENLTGLLNIVYFPEKTGNTDGLQYLNADFGEDKIIPEAAEGKSIFIDQNGFRFSGSTSQLAAFYVPENGCLRILRSGEVDPSGLPHNLGLTAAISKPENILQPEPERKSLPAFIKTASVFDRCDMLERIELAGQIGDWQEAARLSENELQILRNVDHPYELVPVIEAFSHNGDIKLMRELSLEAAENGAAPFELCRSFERMNRTADMTAEVKSAARELASKYFCEKYD